MNIYLVVILSILVLDLILNVGVEVLNLRHLQPVPPDAFKDVVDAKTYRRSQEYTREKTRFGLIQRTVFTLALILFMVLGGFNFIDQQVRNLELSSVLTGLVYILILVVLSGLIDLPFRIYSTFSIEERYGFNRTTVPTFILDIVKGLGLLIVFGAPLLALVLWFFQATGKLAPLYIWVAVSLFQLFLTFIAPMVILPLFNKFVPLEPGELREAIENYARKQGFHLEGIYTMDGSRRSAKSNAFFTGLGKSRRIVLFDTLIKKHKPGELVGVLAHEMGHYKLGHVLKMVTISILETGLLLFLLGFFIENRGLFDAFRMESLSIYASLVFFSFLYLPVSRLLSIVTNVLSRRYEFQADRFVLETTDLSEDFISALKKLGADNLVNLTPHPVKVFLDYTHPPVLQRIQALRAGSG